MKSIIREKRRLSYENKRITPQTVRAFAKIIEGEVKDLTKKEAETIYLMYSVDATDDSSYESQSSDIFKVGEIIESKVIRKVVMRFNTIDNSKNIEIQILHSLNSSSSENFVLVSGDEANWVNGILARFSDVLKSSEPQPKFSKNLGYFVFVAWLVFAIYYFRILYSEVDRIPYFWLRIVVLLGIPFVFTGSAVWLYEKLKSLWPSIELQTGPEHQQISAKKRRIVLWWLGAVIVPILLEIIIDFIKSK